MQDYIINKLTISGFRGIIGESLTDEIIYKMTVAFIEVLKQQANKNKVHILLGRDGRSSGEEIEKTIAQAIVESGSDVTIGGILTTPSVLYLTKTLTFDGSLIITASHNPEEYNGLKFVTSNGHFITKETVNKIKEILKSENYTKIQEKGEIHIDTNIGNDYINHITSSFEKLKTKPRVIIDTVNSSASIMGPEFLRSIGAEVIAINDEPIGKFSRPPEPNPAALTELGRATLGYGMDIGFGLDPDGDRLVIVDENGIPVFEEYTIALAAKAFYEKLKKENALSSSGPLVVNMSTSRTVIDIARSYGIETVLSPVGEANVVKKMQETNSMFGGEGSGGVILRPINFGRDSFVAMILILKLLEESGKKVSEIVSEIPKYIMLKEKIEGIHDFTKYIPNIKDLFHTAQINEEDGIRFDFDDGSWVQVRASNTEPIVRIMGESKDEETIKNMAQKIKSVFTHYI